MEIPEPGLTLAFFLHVLIALAGFILGLMWLILPLMLVIRLGRIHDTLLRIERRGKPATNDNPFDL